VTPVPHDSTHCKACRVSAPEPGHTRCAPCAAARRDADAAERAARRASGRCLTCASKAAKGRRYCRTHLAYYAARAKET
jgi:hypothetical protein